MKVLPPLDQPQRQQAVNPAQSVHVEAPAGSGKTTVLLQRYLTILAQGTRPEEILALTFTRKAAGELRTRIQAEFLKKSESPESASNSPLHLELQELVRAAWLHHTSQAGEPFLQRLQIATFHGFCAQILRLLPYAAGLPPDFTVMEEHEATRRQAEVVEELRRRLAALPPTHPDRQALVRRLLRLNNSWSRLAEELQNLLARRDILTDFIALAKASRDQEAYAQVLLDQLQEMILPDLRALAQDFRQAQIGRQWPELAHRLKAGGGRIAEFLPDEVPGTTLLDLPAWVHLARAILTGKGACYRSFGKPKFPQGFGSHRLCHLLKEIPLALVEKLNIFRELPPLLIHADEAEAVRDLMILLDRLLAIYEALCLARRAVDFTGLEEKALALLRQPGLLPQVWSHLAGHYRHLLVDECQDTSLQQIEILCNLLRGWQENNGSSLMVVGDPKQSIYGWRQARVELFVRTRQEHKLPCPEAPVLEILTLETNFRSTASLIAWVNEVFGQTVMARRATGGVAFHAAVPRPDAAAGSPPRLAVQVDVDPKRGRRREADRLAADLLRLQDSLQAGERVGVLLFTRTHLQVYLEAWRRVGLNLKIKEGLPLLASRAVQQAHNAITAFIRPHDNVAWAGLLQGVAGDDPLACLAAVAQVPGDLWSEKIQAFAEGADASPALRQWYASLAAAIQKVGRKPLHDILWDWLAEMAAWDQTARWEGAQGVANVKTYLELLAAAAAATPAETLSRLQDLLAQTHQPPDPRAQDAAIEVSTVHGAKGLEYDHVFVPFLDWQPLQKGHNKVPFLLEEIPGAGTAIMALDRPYQQEQSSVLYQILKRRSQANILGEARRLFYVAVTRAKKHLYLSGVVKITANGDWDFPAESPLGWLRQHYAESELTTGEMEWPDPILRVQVHAPPETVTEPPASPTVAADAHQGDGGGEGEAAETVALPPALEIQPERRPYEMILPSRLAAGIEAEKAAEEEYPPEDSPFLPLARLRGDLTHRLLEGLAQGRPLPPEKAVAAALRDIIAGPEEALAWAQEILQEIQACQDDPFLAPLLAPDLPVARSEWLLEAWEEPASGDGGRAAEASPPRLFRGKIDRLVFDGREWWLLDYKTSRPGPEVTWEEFAAAEAAKYRPQMEAYRAMAAKYFDLPDPAVIKAYLYFTAAQRAVLV